MTLYRIRCANADYSALDFRWIKNRTFTSHGGDLVSSLAPKFSRISVEDADRSWANSTQDIGVIFSEACSDAALTVGGAATGWSATVKNIGESEVAAAVTYRSGSGTQNWVLRLGALVKHGATIKLTYNTATGATVSTTGSVEINGVTAVQMPDQLSKRIRFILRDKTSTATTAVPVASESVKAAIMEYDSGVVANSNWMARANKATVVTEANGQFDQEYTGSAAVGSLAYVTVVRSDGQSMLKADTVT